MRPVVDGLNCLFFVLRFPCFVGKRGLYLTMRCALFPDTLMPRSINIVSLILMLGIWAQAQTIPELMPQDKEMAVALSAAPEHLQGGASVYVLKQTGFALVRQGTNGFSCIVNRDHPLN
jgi:hypothetical protein